MYCRNYILNLSKKLKIMKTLNLTLAFFIISFFVYSQKQAIDISIACKDGNLFKQDADVFSMGPFQIHGLATNKDYENFEKLVKKQSIVRKFEYINDSNQKENRSAIVSLSTNDENAIESFFKAINLNKLNVNDKSFTLSQKEELKKYLKELKDKHAEEIQKNEQIRRSSMPTSRQASQ